MLEPLNGLSANAAYTIELPVKFEAVLVDLTLNPLEHQYTWSAVVPVGEMVTSALVRQGSRWNGKGLYPVLSTSTYDA